MSNANHEEPTTFNDLLRGVFKSWIDALVKFLNRLGVRPNTVTALGFIGNLAAGILIATGHLFWGAITVIILAPLDALDGPLARLRVLPGRRGGF